MGRHHILIESYNVSLFSGAEVSPLNPNKDTVFLVFLTALACCEAACHKLAPVLRQLHWEVSFMGIMCTAHVSIWVSRAFGSGTLPRRGLDLLGRCEKMCAWISDSHYKFETLASIIALGSLFGISHGLCISPLNSVQSRPIPSLSHVVHNIANAHPPMPGGMYGLRKGQIGLAKFGLGLAYSNGNKRKPDMFEISTGIFSCPCMLMN